MSFELIRKRLVEGRPLVLDSDTGASFRARGVLLGSPGALGQLLRERPAEVARFPTVRQPNTVAVDPDTGRVWIASRSTGELQTIDP